MFTFVPNCCTHVNMMCICVESHKDCDLDDFECCAVTDNGDVTSSINVYFSDKEISLITEMMCTCVILKRTSIDCSNDVYLCVHVRSMNTYIHTQICVYIYVCECVRMRVCLCRWISIYDVYCIHTHIYA